MTKEQIKFIEDNMLMFTTSVSFTPDQGKQLYEIYNSITGENKKPTSCGRCISGVLKTILNKYKQL
jgi:hypothetical protein